MGAGNRALLANFCFRVVGRRELRSLLRFHYRAGMPATVAMVAGAYERGVAREEGRFHEPAAVLCVSYPVLNGPWRALAWPGEDWGDARVVNARVRCLSRVVVEPRYRGVGLASELVRWYLRKPLTRCTESLAAMGGACPFLVAAGMKRIELSRSARDERLLRDLRGLGLNPARVLCGDVGGGGVRGLRAVMLRWAKASKATARGAADRTTRELITQACGALRPTRLVYVHECDEYDGRDTENENTMREGGR